MERIFTQMVLYETVSFDEQKFRAGYRRFHADVERYFADRPADLLRLRVSDSDNWRRVCDFLGDPLPKVPFPNLNVAKGRHEMTHGGTGDRSMRQFGRQITAPGTPRRPDCGRTDRRRYFVYRVR